MGSNTYIPHKWHFLPTSVTSMYPQFILQNLAGKEKPSLRFTVDILYWSNDEIQATTLEVCQALRDQNKESSGGGKEGRIPFQCSNLCHPGIMVLIQAHTTLSDLCSNSKRHSKRKWREPSGVPLLLSPNPRSEGRLGFLLVGLPELAQWSQTSTSIGGREWMRGNKISFFSGSYSFSSSAALQTCTLRLTKFGLSSQFLYQLPESTWICHLIS